MCRSVYILNKVLAVRSRFRTVVTLNFRVFHSKVCALILSETRNGSRIKHPAYAACLEQGMKQFEGYFR